MNAVYVQPHGIMKQLQPPSIYYTEPAVEGP